MSALRKRKVWRPKYADDSPVRGGAGGFHLPQREGRPSYIAPVKTKGHHHA